MFYSTFLTLCLLSIGYIAIVQAHESSTDSSNLVTMQMEHYLPDDRIEAVRKLLMHAFKISEPESVEPIHGWYDEHILLKLHIQNGNYALRLHYDIADQEALAREVEIARIVSLLGLLPHVYAVDIKHGMMLLRYIEKVEIPQEKMQTPVMIRHIGDLLQKLHKTNGFPSHDPSLFSKIAAAEKQHIEKLPPFLQPVFAYANSIEQLLIPIAQKVPTHRRLNPNNVLYDGKKLWFVHWSDAGIDDPYVDLANIVIYYQYNTSQKKELLTYYLGVEPTATELAHVEAMQPIVLINEGLRLIDLTLQRGYALPAMKTLDDIPTLKQFTTHVESGRIVPYLPHNYGLFAMVLLAEAVRIVTSPEFNHIQEQLLQHHK